MTREKNKAQPESSQSFEQALERLERLVQDLEQGDLPLEEALKAFEEGMKLVRFCTQKLEEAEKRVTILMEEGEGVAREVPFEPVEGPERE